MNKKSEIINLIKEQKILPLYFHQDETVSIEVLKALYRAGIRAVEYTNRGDAALQNFTAMRKISDSELNGMKLGIGTIKNKESAKSFIEAGADYIICPGLVDEVIEVTDRHKVLCIPGCMTPTEIIKAENSGIKMIKLFPGNILGPGFMSAIKSLFPDLLFMPTGGVELDKENIEAWFKAGVCAVGMGSKLISNKLLEEKDYSKIEEVTKKAMNIVRYVN